MILVEVLTALTIQERQSQSAGTVCIQILASSGI